MSIVVSLYDFTGLAVEPWARAGFTVYCFDKMHPRDERCSYPDNLLSTRRVGKGMIVFVQWDSDRRDWLKVIKDIVGQTAHIWKRLRHAQTQTGEARSADRPEGGRHDPPVQPADQEAGRQES